MFVVQQQQVARSRLAPQMRAWVPAPGEPAYHFGYHDMHGAHLRIGDLTIQWYAWVFKGAERNENQWSPVWLLELQTPDGLDAYRQLAKVA